MALMQRCSPLQGGPVTSTPPAGVVHKIYDTSDAVGALVHALMAVAVCPPPQAPRQRADIDKRRWARAQEP
eukprot:4786131-Prymnesium_polylepis.1